MRIPELLPPTNGARMDPIAVDVPVKAPPLPATPPRPAALAALPAVPPPSPAAQVVLPAVPPPKSTPLPTPAGAVASAVAAAAVPAATPAVAPAVAPVVAKAAVPAVPTPAPVPPVVAPGTPAGGLVGVVARLVGLNPTKRQAGIAMSAAFSLLVGVAGVRLLFHTTNTSNPPDETKAGEETAALPRGESDGKVRAVAPSGPGESEGQNQNAPKGQPVAPPVQPPPPSPQTNNGQGGQTNLDQAGPVLAPPPPVGSAAAFPLPVPIPKAEASSVPMPPTGGNGVVPPHDRTANQTYPVREPLRPGPTAANAIQQPVLGGMSGPVSPPYEPTTVERGTQQVAQAKPPVPVDPSNVSGVSAPTAPPQPSDLTDGIRGHKYPSRADAVYPPQVNLEGSQSQRTAGVPAPLDVSNIPVASPPTPLPQPSDLTDGTRGQRLPSRVDTVPLPQVGLEGSSSSRTAGVSTPPSTGAFAVPLPQGVEVPSAIPQPPTKPTETATTTPPSSSVWNAPKGVRESPPAEPNRLPPTVTTEAASEAKPPPPSGPLTPVGGFQDPKITLPALTPTGPTSAPSSGQVLERRERGGRSSAPPLVGSSGSFSTTPLPVPLTSPAPPGGPLVPVPPPGGTAVSDVPPVGGLIPVAPPVVGLAPVAPSVGGLVPVAPPAGPTYGAGSGSAVAPPAPSMLPPSTPATLPASSRVVSGQALPTAGSTPSGGGALDPPLLLPGETKPTASFPSPPFLPPGSAQVTPPAIAPSLAPPDRTPGPSPLDFAKPAGGTGEVRPATTTPPPAPQTSYDVDLHDVRAGDSYESISRDFYNDARYAAALQAFNKGRPIQPGKYVEVPPIHVLRKQGGVTPSTAGRVTPVNGSSDWRPMGSTTDPAPAFRASSGRTYIVPKGGSSMPAIAEQVLGDRNRWTEIYDLNPRYLPASVAEGVELKLPDAAPASK